MGEGVRGEASGRAGLKKKSFCDFNAIYCAAAEQRGEADEGRRKNPRGSSSKSRWMALHPEVCEEKNLKMKMKISALPIKTEVPTLSVCWPGTQARPQTTTK